MFTPRAHSRTLIQRLYFAMIVDSATGHPMPLIGRDHRGKCRSMICNLQIVMDADESRHSCAQQDAEALF